MKPNLEKIYNYIENNFIVLIASLGILFSPFVVDYSSLPKGYELPKVHFIIAISLMIIILGLIKYFGNLYKYKKLLITKDFGIFLAFLIIFVLSSLVSPHFTTSIYGNSFRDQGVITHLLIVGMAYVLYKSINRRNFKLLALAFIISALVQSGIAYIQTVKLIQTDPKALLEGYWVNGTFGQANFFSGRLLLGLIFLAYFIGKSIQKKFAWLLKIFFLICSLFIVGALLFSLSIWGIITAAAAFLTILFYELIPKKAFTYLFFIAAAAASIFGVYYLFTSTVFNLRIEIWKGIINIIFKQAELKNTILGYGFDTLGEGFKDFGYFQGLLIDRAHNFFFDILFQVGSLGLLLTLVILVKPLLNLRKKVSDRKFTFAFFALFFWLLRSFIHESGIVNMVDFLVILAMTLALGSSTNSDKISKEEE